MKLGRARSELRRVSGPGWAPLELLGRVRLDPVKFLDFDWADLIYILYGFDYSIVL